jgi:hypothetical protein
MSTSRRLHGFESRTLTRFVWNSPNQPTDDATVTICDLGLWRNGTRSSCCEHAERTTSLVALFSKQPTLAVTIAAPVSPLPRHRIILLDIDDLTRPVMDSPSASITGCLKIASGHFVVMHDSGPSHSPGRNAAAAVGSPFSSAFFECL